MMTEELVKIMSINSTSGKEAELARYIAENIHVPGATLEKQEVDDGTFNLFYRWGNPNIIFCTHLDTVPPFIAPETWDDKVTGRGACDAKGQIITALNVCRNLYSEGESNFGLLLVAGEETGSVGARVANNLIKGCRYVIIGEPTENKLIRAGKGIQLYEVQIRGASCHSGYPQYGDDAIERMRLFLNRLAAVDFPSDPVLGSTTYNIGQLSSENAYNVLPDAVSFKIYFRTTFASSNLIKNILDENSDKKTSVIKIREDKPFEYYHVDGFKSDIVAFGCDGPCLTNLGKCLLYGPGTIKVAHTVNEFINVSDIKKAVTDLEQIYYILKKEI
jgi:acetylornithine deacetylase